MKWQPGLKSLRHSMYCFLSWLPAWAQQPQVQPPAWASKAPETFSRHSPPRRKCELPAACRQCDGSASLIQIAAIQNCASGECWIFAVMERHGLETGRFENFMKQGSGDGEALCLLSLRLFVSRKRLRGGPDAFLCTTYERHGRCYCDYQHCSDQLEDEQQRLHGMLTRRYFSGQNQFQ